MNKVMTRTKRRPGTHPPVRHDTRRPGRTPARTTPGGGHPSAAALSRALTTPAPTSPQDAIPPLSRPVPQPRPTDHFADLLLAVLSGRRPVHSMLRHTAGRAYDELAWLAERGPLRTTHGAHPVVRDIGYYVAAPGALEVFARIGAGDRLRAMAFRLEHGPDHRWRCTAVELGGPRLPHQDDD
ncbi:Rv3235 family protein [Streptomyces sp. CA-210063]|uniref:Rv3235 family protein n=1 Tax=Streptomyces sp. CA-210063 TaxID=2801029 RepID=UPI00214B1B48|nr:Rv3235 family protein [Streptomyces sp. CA-210063]UUU33466.1 Rv3235 family protein [Streptomyces sp. CA-210063]